MFGTGLDASTPWSHAWRWVKRSLAARLILLAVAFGAVPAFLYGEFSAAETVRRQALLDRLRVEAELITRGLEQQTRSEVSVVDMRQSLEHLVPDGLHVRLLFRPNLGEGAPSPVVLVAAKPLPGDLDAERLRLTRAGVTEAVPSRCAGGVPLELRYEGTAGQELLTAIVAFTTPSGCWAVVTSQGAEDGVGRLLLRPYWNSPEVRMAALVYGVLAGLVLSVIIVLWLNLRRFGREARAVADGETPTGAPPFAEANGVPELDDVARDLDRMVGNLHATADAFRFAAEENAHAFKTPIATIAQAIEPLRRSVVSLDPENGAVRSLHLVESALARLDSLVAASRRLDQVNADLVQPPRRPVDLTKLVSAMAESYDDVAAERGIVIRCDLAPHCVVRAGSEMMETVVENLVDNALSFSPAGGAIDIRMERRGKQVELSIEDNGPGVASSLLPHLFERYVSHRPQTDPSGASHFGIGLWIVRRNVMAAGGAISAQNRVEGGLRMKIVLPLAQGG